MTPLSELPSRFDGLVWKRDLNQLPPWQAWAIHGARLLHALGRDLKSGQLTLHAMSLVYTTLLSLVPLLAVSFSVLKGFGVHNQLQPMLLQALEPLGDKSHEIAAQLIQYVDNTNVGVLGSVGLAFLLYSVITLVSKIEQVFNYTWRVEAQRPMMQRVSQYLSVLLIGPVLVFSAIGATASFRNLAVVDSLAQVEPLGYLIEIAGRLLPYLLIVLAFAFAYVFIPNTRVKPRSALIGALIAGLLWQSLGYVFAHFMAGSTRYAAIYSGLAILILFMIWVYIAWVIVLIGASIAFYDQNPEYLNSRARDPRLSNRLRERVALAIAARIAARHLGGEPPCSVEALGRALRLPASAVEHCIAMLARDGILIATAEHPPRYLLVNDPARIPLPQLLANVRRFGEDPLQAEPAADQSGVIALEQRLERAAAETLDGLSLADLAADENHGAAGAAARPASD